MDEVMKKYGDIIDLPYHGTTSRDPMDPIKRAAQFSPFAALTGHEEAIEETGRLTERFREPDEDVKAYLDRQIAQIMADPTREVEIRYFKPDSRKAGGAYVTKRGRVRKLDSISKDVIMEEGGIIPVHYIVDISILE